MSDDRKVVPGGPLEPPRDDEDISIEFVDHEEVPPAEGSSRAGERENETGMAEIQGSAAASSSTVAELEQKVVLLEERILRRQADFENYRRRQEREQDQLRRQAMASAVEGLLPALDDLDRALDAVRGEVSSDHMQGLTLVRQRIMDTLGKMGLEEIEAQGLPFDPALHEAVSIARQPALPPMTVTAVFQKGYTLGGKLLKPARVEVNGPAEETQGGGDA